MSIITTPLYWDCECKEHYIHSKEETECTRCKCVYDEQPDSHENEVDDLKFKVKKAIDDYEYYRGGLHRLSGTGVNSSHIVLNGDKYTANVSIQHDAEDEDGTEELTEVEYTFEQLQQYM